jgi:TctA family transporter
VSAPGSGFFRAGAIGMIAVGFMHAGTHVTPPPPGSEAALAAMRAFTVTALGLTWSVEDAYETLSLSYSWMSVWLGVAGLVALRLLRPDARSLRALAALFALGALGLVAISAAYRVAPPLHLYALVAAVFAVGALRARG